MKWRVTPDLQLVCPPKEQFWRMPPGNGNIGLLTHRLGETDTDLSIYRPYKSEGFWAKVKRVLMRRPAPEPLFYFAMPRPHNSSVDLDSFKMLGTRGNENDWIDLHFRFKFSGVKKDKEE